MCHSLSRGRLQQLSAIFNPIVSMPATSDTSVGA